MGKQKISIPGMKGVPTDIMNQIMSGSGDMLGKMNENFEIIATNLEEVRENQNQQMLALASIYSALETLAKKEGVKLPKPLINMEIEEQ